MPVGSSYILCLPIIRVRCVRCGPRLVVPGGLALDMIFPGAAPRVGTKHAHAHKAPGVARYSGVDDENDSQHRQYADVAGPVSCTLCSPVTPQSTKGTEQWRAQMGNNNRLRAPRRGCWIVACRVRVIVSWPLQVHPTPNSGRRQTRKLTGQCSSRAGPCHRA